jgi:hypothetical protein
VDYAHILKDLSDTHFPEAGKIVLVQDNLNTHKPASLYEAFPAAEPGFAVTGHTRGGSAPGKPRNCWVSAAASGRNGRKT